MVSAAPVWGKFMTRVYVGDSTQAYADSVFRARHLTPDSRSTEGSADPISDQGAEDVQGRGFLLPIPEPWPILPGLISKQVDNRTGLLASRWCPPDSAYTELYLPGTEPTEFCDMTGFRIRRTTGGQAGAETMTFSISLTLLPTLLVGMAWAGPNRRNAILIPPLSGGSLDREAWVGREPRRSLGP